MVMVLNTTARKISAAGRPVRKMNPDTGRSTVIKPPGKMYDFVPGIITNVSDADLKLLKEIPYIQRCFDNGTFVTGASAKRVAQDAKAETKKREAEVAEELEDTEEDLLSE